MNKYPKILTTIMSIALVASNVAADEMLLDAPPASEEISIAEGDSISIDISPNEEALEETPEETLEEKETIIISEESISEDNISEDNISEDNISGDPVELESGFPDSEEIPVVSDEDSKAFSLVSEDEAEEISLLSQDAPTEDLAYIKGRPLTDKERAEQLSLFDSLPQAREALEADETDGGGGSEGIAVVSDSEISMLSTTEPPSDYKAEGYYTKVKNQGEYGICWAMTDTALAEAYLGWETSELSSEHLAYFIANHANDPLGNTANDIYSIRDYHQGGSPWLGAIHLTTWSGFTSESKVPTPTSGGALSWDSSLAYQDTAYLTDAVFANYRNTADGSVNIDMVKELLTTYQGVGCTLYYHKYYYYPDTAAYCCTNNGSGVNHAVTIVGWDDNYKRKISSTGTARTENIMIPA